MKADRAAVAGFFEDLPVLLFVLAGVTTLVLTSVFVAERLELQKKQKDLEEAARNLANVIVRKARLYAGPDLLPLVSYLSSLNISDEVAPGGTIDFAVSVFVVHPLVKCILDYSTNPDAIPRLTGSALRLANAIDDQCGIVILEVRTLAW